MAISPPSFNVQALSPSALLSGTRDGNDFADQILRFGQNVALQRLQGRAASRRQRQRIEAEQEAAFQSDLRRGLVTPASDLDDTTFELPGERQDIELPTFEGPGGKEFVRQTDVETARQLQRRAEPVEQIAGREAFEGTTRGHLVGPAGGQRSTEEVLGFAQGDVDSVREQIRQIPINEVRESAEARLDAMLEDERFTLAEERQLTGPEGPLDAARMESMVSTARSIQEMDTAQRRRVGKAQVEANQKFQKVTQGGGRENLTSTEAKIVGKKRAGEPLSASEQAVFNRVNPNLVPRVSAPEIQEDLKLSAKGASLPSNDKHNAALIWLQSHLFGPEGEEVTNENLAETIRKTVGGLSDDHLSSFLQNGPSSYRHAFALYDNGYLSRQQVNKRLEKLHFVFPFGRQGAFDAYETVDPAFADMNPEREVGEAEEDGVSGGGRDTGDGGEEEVSRFRQSREEVREAWEPMMQSEEGQRTLLRRIRAALAGPDSLAAQIREDAQIREQAAQRTQGERASALRENAENLRAWADSIESNPQRFTTTRDSVWLQVAEDIGLLDPIGS